MAKSSDNLAEIPVKGQGRTAKVRRDYRAKRPAKRLQGRPSGYSEAIAREICERIMAGRSLSKVCLDEDMPLRQTVHNWLLAHPSFFDNYTRACSVRREYRFETLEDVVDMEEDPQRARLKVDVIKWQLSKEEPKKYGDKLDVTSDGEKVVPILGAVQAPTIAPKHKDVIEAEIVSDDDSTPSQSLLGDLTK